MFVGKHLNAIVHVWHIALLSFSAGSSPAVDQPGLPDARYVTLEKVSDTWYRQSKRSKAVTHRVVAVWRLVTTRVAAVNTGLWVLWQKRSDNSRATCTLAALTTALNCKLLIDCLSLTNYENTSSYYHVLVHVHLHVCIKYSPKRCLASIFVNFIISARTFNLLTISLRRHWAGQWQVLNYSPVFTLIDLALHVCLHNSTQFNWLQICSYVLICWWFESLLLAWH